LEKLLFEYQINRSTIFGFLSNGHVIQFVRADRDMNGVHFTTHSAPQYLLDPNSSKLPGPGLQMLCALMADEKYQDLAASRILLKLDDPSSTVKLGRVLGVGRTATVVEATLPLTKYVDIALLAATYL
jgi:hypothetical protein